MVAVLPAGLVPHLLGTAADLPLDLASEACPPLSPAPSWFDITHLDTAGLKDMMKGDAGGGGGGGGAVRSP